MYIVAVVVSATAAADQDDGDVCFQTQWYLIVLGSFDIYNVFFFYFSIFPLPCQLENR